MERAQKTPHFASVLNPKSISRIVKSNYVMSIKRNAPGKLSWGKKVLCQINAGDVTMMGHFGEQIQNALVVATISHEVI